MKVVVARAVAACACVCAYVASAPLHAVAVRTWSVASAESFAKGRLERVAVDQDGHLRLAPELETLWGPAGGIVWDVASTDSRRDGAFIALSGPARLLRVGPRGQSETWFEQPGDGIVTALASNGRDGVFFALSPGGRIHRARGPKNIEIIAELEAGYVWALHAERDGTLWVATGDPGSVVRIEPSRDPTTVFSSEDDPIRCLAPAPQGGVFAGTGSRGRVLRISSSGTSFVLLDAEEDEVVSLAVAPDGALFALAARARARTRARGKEESVTAADDTEARVTVQDTPSEPEELAEEDPVRSPTAKPQRPPAGVAGGALYRIDPDGSSWRLWEATGDLPYDLVIQTDGTPVVATGESGRLYRLDRDGKAIALLRFPSDQVTALSRGAEGRLLIGGSSDARVSALGPRPARSGTYVTVPIDAGMVADWGAIHWQGTVPQGSGVAVRVRSGNTSEPDGTWSPWSSPGPAAGGGGAPSGVPPARWSQVEVDITSSPRGDSPVVRRVELFYLPRNRPPQVRRLDVQPVGLALLSQPQAPPSGGAPRVTDDPVGQRASRVLGRRPAGALRRSYEPGVRSFTWEAQDPDGDTLLYGVEIRRSGTERWLALAEGLEDPFYSWDSRAMPDGTYEVRLTADDRSDNALTKNRTERRTSDPFVVDNTPPRIERVEVAWGRSGVQVDFRAKDPGGRVAAVDTSLDGKVWRRLDPLDGVDDSEEERYRLELDQAPGARSLRLRVTDSSGNVGGTMEVVEPR